MKENVREEDEEIRKHVKVAKRMRVSIIGKAIHEQEIQI